MVAVVVMAAVAVMAAATARGGGDSGIVVVVVLVAMLVVARSPFWLDRLYFVPDRTSRTAHYPLQTAVEHQRRARSVRRMPACETQCRAPAR